MPNYLLERTGPHSYQRRYVGQRRAFLHHNLQGLVYKGSVASARQLPSHPQDEDAYYVRDQDVTVFARYPFEWKGWGVLQGNAFRELADAL